MAEWQIKRGESQFAAPDLETLQAWARSGNIVQTDYVFNPVLQQWMYAKDLGELQAVFGSHKIQAEKDNLNRMSWGLGCLGILVCFFFWPAGIVLLIIAIVMSAFYHVKK